MMSEELENELRFACMAKTVTIEGGMLQALFQALDTARKARDDNGRLVLDLRDAISAESTSVEHSIAIAVATRAALSTSRNEARRELAEEALRLANGRWEEWGARAVQVAELLEAATEPQP